MRNPSPPQVGSGPTTAVARLTISPWQAPIIDFGHRISLADMSPKSRGSHRANLDPAFDAPSDPCLLLHLAFDRWSQPLEKLNQFDLAPGAGLGEELLQVRLYRREVCPRSYGSFTFAAGQVRPHIRPDGA
jgi:hypothetical protein